MPRAQDAQERRLSSWHNIHDVRYAAGAVGMSPVAKSISPTIIRLPHQKGRQKNQLIIFQVSE